MVGFLVLIKVFIGKCYRFGMVIGIGYRGDKSPGNGPPTPFSFFFPRFPPADPVIHTQNPKLIHRSQCITLRCCN